MTYTVTDAVEATRRLLYGASRPTRNSLSAPVTAAATSLVCTWPTVDIPKRSLISVGQETLYVWDKNDSTLTLTVSRGEQGTTPASHAASDVVEVNPRFSGPSIAQALQDEIRAWEPDLFRVADVALSSASWPGLVDVGADYSEAYGIAAARYERSGEWIDMKGSTLIRGLDTADFPAGVGVSVLPPPGWQTDTSGRWPVTSPAGFRVALAMPFDLDFAPVTADLVDTVGLSRSMCDLAVWGAAIRLLAAAEVSRTDPTGQGQAATQVRVGDQTQVAAALQRKFNDRFSQEVAKLLRRYPLRF